MPVTAAAPDWHLVLSRDGTVLSATDGAPPSWVGTRLDDRGDVPEDLKEAERAVLSSAEHSFAPVVVSARLQSIQRAVHLTVIDALPLRRAPTDLRALLRSTLEALHQQAHACDVALHVTVDDRVPARVSLDSEKIAWATTVLVGNALRYVRHGSQLKPGGSIAVRVTCNTAGSEITVEVEDDGAGIRADTLRHLFIDAPGHPRVGLGLSMVREVVAAHAGHIEAHSDTDSFRHGTTIRFTLPV
jgi:signal transduction histidine kinase